MGIYVISWTMTREITSAKNVDGWEFKAMLRVVFDTFCKQDAAQFVARSFAQTPDALEGWRLTGNPSVLHVTHEVIDSWLPYADPLPANEVKRPDYLHPVDDD